MFKLASAQSKGNVSPETGQFLRFIVLLIKPKKILEIGTSNGYSTLWLASAAKEVGAKIFSIEQTKERIDEAKKNLQNEGLLDYVELICGNALQEIPRLPSSFDLVFFDATKKEHSTYLKLVSPKLSSHALLVVDNVVSHKEKLSAFLDLIKSSPEFEYFSLPLGKGLYLCLTKT